MTTVTLTAQQAEKVLRAMKAAQFEFTVLVPRLVEPYRANAQACADDLKRAIGIVEAPGAEP